MLCLTLAKILYYEMLMLESVTERNISPLSEIDFL